MVRVGLGKAEHGLFAVLDGGVEAQWRRNDGDGAAGLVAAWAEMVSWFEGHRLDEIEWGVREMVDGCDFELLAGTVVRGTGEVVVIGELI
ncbi:hypothetical protein M0R45_008165 [Rubus argutus]|uniref:MHC class I antigen n=1 Tax=Rubus argutus TaxID=59490 RepID=A0AAW1Y0G0_RUBAR